MHGKNFQNFEDLRQIHQRRLNILERQAAIYGASAEAHIVLEIENIKNEIEKIDSLLLESKKLSSETSKQGASTILFLAADPSDQSRLRLGNELRVVKEIWKISISRTKFQLDSRESLRVRDIYQAMIDAKPTIVHFSGHGIDSGELCFENDDGKTQLVDPDAIADLFELSKDYVECVVLNACYSEIQANAISRHINYVIGMKNPIGDKAAIAFSLGFYQGIFGEASIEESFKSGCTHIRLQGIPEHLTPIMKKR